MKHVQVYCDHCGNQMLSFPSTITLNWSVLGNRTYELCEACAKAFSHQLESAKACTQKRRPDPSYAAQQSRSAKP